MSLYVHVLEMKKLLRGVDGWLDKAVAFAATKKFDANTLLQSRLAPDMFPLVRQVQLVSDFAKGAVARLSGTDNPRFEDNETSIDGLKQRLARTLEFIRSVPESAFAGAEDRDLTIQAGPRIFEFKGLPYLLGYALPNLNFHATTAYAILRHNGVEIGKADYIGPAD
jgi:hypothetical protein